MSACRRFTIRSVLQPSFGFHPTPPHGDAVAFRSRLPPVRPRKGLASTCSPPIAQSCPANSCSLRTSLVMPTLITKSSTEHATASGKGVAIATSTLRSCYAPTALHLLLQVRAVPLAPRCSRNLLGSQVPRQRPVRNAAMRRARLLVPCRRERRPRQSCRPRDEDARGRSLCSATAQTPGQPRSDFRGVVPMQDRDDFFAFFNRPCDAISLAKP